MRPAFGSVQRIGHVDVFDDWKFITVQLCYEEDRRCLLKARTSDQKWYDKHIHADAPEGSASIEFSNAFIKNAPSDIRTKLGTDETTETQYTPLSGEPFKRELRHFSECIEGGS